MTTNKKTFTLLSGELYEVTATDRESAKEKLFNALGQGSSEGVSLLETVTDFHGSQPCEACPGNAKGWHIADEAGVTYSGLKQAQNEAIVKGVQYAIDYLEDINHHDGANALEGFLNVLTRADFTEISEWQKPWLESHGLYSEECEKIENDTSAAQKSADFLEGVQWAIDTMKAEEFQRHADILETISNIKHGTPCDNCATRIPSDIHAEELGLCLTCSDAYFTEEESN